MPPELNVNGGPKLINIEYLADAVDEFESVFVSNDFEVMEDDNYLLIAPLIEEIEYIEDHNDLNDGGGDIEYESQCGVVGASTSGGFSFDAIDDFGLQNLFLEPAATGSVADRQPDCKTKTEHKRSK